MRVALRWRPVLVLLFAILQPASGRTQVISQQTGDALVRSRALLPVVSGPDTAWIGHVTGPTGLPGTPGGYGPYFIGRGLNQVVWPAGFPAPPPPSFDGVWDFDSFQPGEPDSSMGWWMVNAPYDPSWQTELDDSRRPWFALDYGNQGNYVSNVVTCPAPCGVPAGAKRTFGVTGYWHRDGGALVAPVVLPGTAPVPVAWAPLAGAASAWCGLRAHGDVAVADLVANGGTGNAFNQTILQYKGSPPGRFPCYGGQWDQMLYRDVFLADGSALAISFLLSTNMSTGEITRPGERTGWFEKDPLKPVVAGDGNFLSSTSPGAPRPVDVFRVYVGVPVEPVVGLNNDFVGADGISRDVYDPRRRWFSEVLAINKPLMEVFSATGVTPAGPVVLPVLPGGLGSFVQSILDAQPGAGGLVRVVFRVKTNRGYDDEDAATSGFSSGTAGAAVLDNVVVNAWAAANGNFEAAGSINNDPAVAATAAWKSTGKPPDISFHPHNVLALPFNDPCGPIAAAARRCNMQGAVMSPGFHDVGDKPGGIFGTSDQDRKAWLVSPTINLRSPGVGSFNAMGIDAEIADATSDIALWFDVHQNLFNYRLTGVAYRVGWQSYPDVQPNGAPCWGQPQFPPSYASNADQPGCYAGFGGDAPGAFAKLHGLIRTANPNGIPDSLRAYVEVVNLCYSLPLTAATCSPAFGPNAGGYFDNFSIAFIDGSPPPLAIVDPWDLYNDAFPVNPGGLLPSNPAFNSLTASVKTGRNIAQMKGNLSRHDIPGDTAVVRAEGAGVRVDMIFRIKPGVGNRVVVGAAGAAVAAFPGGPAAAPGDASFWGEYMGNAGVFGTGGTGVAGAPHDPDGPGGPIPPGTQWDQNWWNSARCDTVDLNLWPVDGLIPNLNRLTPGYFASMYHEADPKLAIPGFAAPKPRCFMIAVGAGSTPTCSTIPAPCNITCSEPALGPYPPAWTGPAGLVVEIPGAPGFTLEYTKILPDNQFTPGTHVEYFFRRSLVGAPVTQFEITPDTNFVYPQLGERSLDGHRWQEFSVLPDRWKNAGFGGPGLACMLVIDLGDRRGDELRWVSAADTIGLTASTQRGAHNGWRGNTTSPSVAGRNIGGDPTIAVPAHLGQAGTLWDLYQVKGGESNVPSGRFGSRGASTAAPGLAAGKFSTLGPTLDMMTVYKTAVLLGSDLGTGALGPYPDQTDDDIGAFTAYMATPGGNAPRGMAAIGSNLVQGQADGVWGHPSFFPNYFRASLRLSDYQLLSGNPAHVPDLTTSAPLTPFTYGVWGRCGTSLDVLTAEAPAPPGTSVSTYEPFGGGAPYVASVYTGTSIPHNWISLVSGWALGLTMGTEATAGPPPSALIPVGATHYLHNMLNAAFGALTCGPLGVPVGVGDSPAGSGSGFVNALSLRSANPSRQGETRLTFTLARTEKAEVRIYDVTGRAVRVVANRVFSAGEEHLVVWDGTADDGRRVPSGVYFYQVKTPTWSSRKKLTLLGN